VPEWLAAAHPGRTWRTLRSCRLRVPVEGGAGLDLEASDELGYLVDGVDAEPGQDPALRAGSAIVAIGGVPLLGLGEDALEEAFGEHFRDGASVLLVDAEELRKAVAEAEANGAGEADIVLEHGSVVYVPVSGAALTSMAAGRRETLEGDLAQFCENSSGGLRAQISCPEGAITASIVVTGEPDEIRTARPELGALLAHYGLCVGARAAANEAETLEVEGMVMQSLPARRKRRRQYVDDADEAAGAGAAAQDAGEEDAKDLALPAGEELRQYEYMDHTADVILHSWGANLSEALAQNCVAFFSYMTDLDKVDMTTKIEVEATGQDILDMLYHLLDEFLFSFGTEFIMCRRVEILELDEVNFKVRARGFGEKFDLKKHPQGTEIKAITMHQMKILTPKTLTTEEGTIPRTSDLMEGGTAREGFPYECYVLVDI